MKETIKAFNEWQLNDIKLNKIDKRIKELETEQLQLETKFLGFVIVLIIILLT